MKVSPSLAAIVVAGIVAASVVADEPEKIGQVRFAVSCRADVQKPFERAVALLHSFWYLEAAKAFTAVAQADPDCAIAYWGLAMSNWTQIWSPPPPAALKRGWEAVEKAKAASAKTARERDFVAAAEAFFKDADKVDHRTRALAYGKVMEQMAQRYPNEREVMAFYALSLQATADPHDKTYASQKRSAEIAEKIFAAEPDHPGAAHYMIHGYDYPPLAATLSSRRRCRMRCTCPRTSTCCSACGRRRCRATSRPRRRRRTVETPTTGCTRSTIWYTATCSRPRTRKPGGFSTRRARS